MKSKKASKLCLKLAVPKYNFGKITAYTKSSLVILIDVIVCNSFSTKESEEFASFMTV